MHKKDLATSGQRHDNRNRTKKRGGDLIRASDVEPKKLVGVWNHRFHRGKLGFVAGEPGLGKSLVAIHMAATVSTGGDWPLGKGSARRGDVIYITAEDTAADTIRPRLEAAGADLRRVHVVETVTDALGQRPFSLVSDLVWLEQWLQAVRKPRLVIIDPVNACLSATEGRAFNPNSVPQVRALLGHLEAIATKYGVAIVLVTHFTKAKGGSALSRVTGSFAFVAAARSVFTVVRKANDPDQRVFAPAKNNLAPDVDALTFRIKQRIVSDNIPAPRVVFT